MSPLCALGAALTICLPVLEAAPARAHPVAQPETGAAGSYFETAFVVSHGCDGSPTVAVTLKIPEGVGMVKPRAMQGWTIAVKKHPSRGHAAGHHGEGPREAVDEIVWRGGPLPNDQYETFSVRMRLPDTPGQTLYFPMTQECETGARRWDEIPPAGKAWSGMRSPPPFVKVAPSLVKVAPEAP